MRVELVYIHAVSDNISDIQTLLFCSFNFKNGWPRHFVLMFCVTARLALFSLFVLKFFAKVKAFVLTIKIIYIVCRGVQSPLFDIPSSFP